MDVANKIKQLRVSQKITQKELAEMINVTQATITKIESGLTKNTSVDIAIKISNALGVSVYELFGDGQEEISSTIKEKLLSKEVSHLEHDIKRKLVEMCEDFFYKDENRLLKLLIDHDSKDADKRKLSEEELRNVTDWLAAFRTIRTKLVSYYDKYKLMNKEEYFEIREELIADESIDIDETVKMSDVFNMK